jgi:hypothetical protein
VPRAQAQATVRAGEPPFHASDPLAVPAADITDVTVVAYGTRVRYGHCGQQHRVVLAALAGCLAGRDRRATALPRLQAITAAYREVFAWLAAHATVITIDTTRAVP